MNTLSGIKNNQQGAALLVLFFMIFAVGASVFLSSVNTHSVEVRRQNDVRIELEKAKQALIAYARNYPAFAFDNDGDGFTNDEGPGRLVCPDVDNDTFADSTILECTDNVRGRLPESVTYTAGTGTISISLNNYFANIDEQFWYVVSPAFKEITTTQVNHSTTGNLSIDGVSGYVAVIIAPGEALAGQNRSSSQTSAANYLEQSNVTGTAFINSYPANPDAFNDQVIGIKTEELMLQSVLPPISDDDIIDLNLQAQIAYYAANTALPANTTELLTFMENDPSISYMNSNGIRMLFHEGYFPSSGYTYYGYHATHGGTQHWYDPYIGFRRQECGSTVFFYVPNTLPDEFYPSGISC